MKFFYLLVSLALCLGPVTEAQNTASQTFSQAQTLLSKNNYTQARTLFLQAYEGFSAEGDCTQAIKAGTQAAYTYYQENRYQEAFQLCREMNQLIQTEEQKQGKALYPLRFEVTQVRLAMYIKLKNGEQAKGQLVTLENYVQQAGGDQLTAPLLYAQVEYHYTFGDKKQGDAAFQRLIQPYKDNKSYDKVNACYENLIGIARKSHNIALMENSYAKYLAWADSANTLIANDKLNELRQEYDQSLQLLQETEERLSTKQYTIISLIVLVLILLGLLLFTVLLCLRLIVRDKKLKQAIQLIQEHNEQQNSFLQEIAAQMEPTLQRLDQAALSLHQQAPSSTAHIRSRIEGLRQFAAHVQELSDLQGSLTEPYEVTPFQVSSFTKKLIEEIQPKVHPSVKLSTDIPQLEIKSNAEQVARILSHLLQNAALSTKEGTIKLEFKRKGAHLCQFILTDSGTGLSEEERETLFKPFHRPHDLAEGDGLGLPTCALIAQKLNGSLTLDKEYKKGCRFVLALQI